MDTGVVSPLAVSINELTPTHVAYIRYQVTAEQHEMHQAIHACFQRVQAWVRQFGIDPNRAYTVGALNLVNGQLSSYDCCIRVPELVQGGSEGIAIKDIPGGRYAVVTIQKDPSIIGDSIRRFYQEYVPQNNLTIDGTRPTYEIYYESTVEYSVPVV